METGEIEHRVDAALKTVEVENAAPDQTIATDQPIESHERARSELLPQIDLALSTTPENDARPERPDYEQVRKELEIRAQGDLRRFGWVDRPKGVVRIPVEMAIQKVIEERSK